MNARCEIIADAQNSGVLSVLCAPLFDPSSGRIALRAPEGLSLQEIVALAIPEATSDVLAQTRISLVSDRGTVTVRRDKWERIYPKTGVHVVIRVIPKGDTLRPILQVVVAIAAIAVGSFFTPILGAFWAGIAATAFTIGANLLINALVPPSSRSANSSSADDTKSQSSYSISGWKNPFTPNGAVPIIMGRHRFAPPISALPYMEIVGDLQYVRAVFNFGYGPINLSDFRIGDTPLSSFEGVTTEVRSGYESDAPLTLTPEQVFEDPDGGVELIRPLPRDGAGNVVAGAGIETPILRVTAIDSYKASVIIGFPSGLISYDDAGNPQSLSVAIRIRSRLVGATTWATTETITVTAATRDPMYRQVTWVLPVRGTHEIQITRMTDERTSNQLSDRTSLVTLQSFRPEYPMNYDKPMALVSIRIKASYQLNGSLDNFNAIASHICPDWNRGTGTWITRETRNPASYFRLVLQGNAFARPYPDDRINLSDLQEWHEFCEDNGLKYDAIHDKDDGFENVLKTIAAAGRASPRYDGKKWSVVIDRPRELQVIDHINPRNSFDFKWSKNFIDPPHAFRVPFNDSTNGWQAAERIVRWPGYSGDITLTEQLDLPGKTDPEEIYIEARRRMYEIIHRAEKYTAIQNGAVRTATRGDLVMGSWDVLQRTMKAARVVRLQGHMVVLDDVVEMLAGQVYAIRYRQFENDEDTIGTSVVCRIATVPGLRNTLRLIDAVVFPAEGEVIHFGLLATESLPMIVTSVEPGEDFTSIFTMIPAATIIDDLMDEEIVPAWSGRVGSEIEGEVLPPPVPRFTGVRTGIVGTGLSGGLAVLLSPGLDGTIPTSSYQIQHRLFGASTWTTITISAAAGGSDVAGYSLGDVVQMRVRALAADATPSTYTTIISVTIGSEDGAVPAALPSGSITITGGLGQASIVGVTGADTATLKLQIYRSASSTLNRATDAVGSPITVAPSTSWSYVDGDATRTNMLLNAGFDSAANWVTDASWSIAAGKATHTTGAVGDIGQSATLFEDVAYRYAVTASSVSDGSVTPLLFGTVDVPGTAIVADGRFIGTLIAEASQTDFGFSADADFDGSIDDAVLFAQTPQCVPQGTVYYWIEPQNASGIAGPVSGPFTASII